MEFETYCKHSLNEFFSDSLEVIPKHTNLFENGKAFNEKSLKESKNHARENYFQINQIIKLDETSFPTEFEYIHHIVNGD